MSGIEFVVRPFSNTNVKSIQIPQAGSQQSQANIHLKIGIGAGYKTVSGNASVSETLYVKKFPTETTTDG